MIHSLLKGSPSQEQLFAFLFEPGHVEVLFSLLVQKKFSDEVRERVFRVRYVSGIVPWGWGCPYNSITIPLYLARCSTRC